MSLGDNSVFSLPPFRKALEGTVDLPLSRRDLLKVAGAGLAAVAIVPACGTAAPIDVSGDDASTVETPDMTTAQATPDLTVAGPGCAAGAGDVGKAPAAFMMDTATLIRTMRVFVCRDAMGLYAISSACTHAGCTPTLLCFPLHAAKAAKMRSAPNKLRNLA